MKKVYFLFFVFAIMIFSLMIYAPSVIDSRRNPQNTMVSSNCPNSVNELARFCDGCKPPENLPGQWVPVEIIGTIPTNLGSVKSNGFSIKITDEFLGKETEISYDMEKRSVTTQGYCTVIKVWVKMPSNNYYSLSITEEPGGEPVITDFYKLEIQEKNSWTWYYYQE